MEVPIKEAAARISSITPSPSTTTRSAPSIPRHTACEDDDDSLDAELTKQLTDKLLLRQLECEMQKRRPDHFVIGVVCRTLGGVPSRLRSQVWKELLGVARTEQPSLDQSILQVEEDLDNQRVIAADAIRTRSNERLFQKPETIELVVKLLTYYCKSRSIRYKQGMNEVLAPFLLLTEKRPESKGSTPLPEGVIFQCFHALIDRFLPHVFIDQEFRSLQCSLHLYRLLMLYHDPELCHYLDQHDMTPELYVTPWFMTLFARSLPPEFVFYLWDFFLVEEGPYLLHFVAYALVVAHRETILRADIAMLPQVLSSLTFTSRDDLIQVCGQALVIAESTPNSFNRDLCSVCYGGLKDAIEPFYDQLHTCSSLRIYPEELIQNLMNRLAFQTKQKQSFELISDATIKHELIRLRSLCSNHSPRLSQGCYEHEEEEMTPALQFILLDCRPLEEYVKSHLSLSHHIDPTIMERPDALDELMKGFALMKGCHFCFVGPSGNLPSSYSRFFIQNAANKTKVPRKESRSNVFKKIHGTIDVTECAALSLSPLKGFGRQSRRMHSSGKRKVSANKIGHNGVYQVHAEHVSVTRLVFMFLQKGFKYVSRLDRGFRCLEDSIRSMDQFTQEQLLVASPLPPSIPEPVVVPSSGYMSATTGGFDLLAKIGLSRSRAPLQDESTTELSGQSTCFVNSGVIAMKSSKESKQAVQKAKSTTNATVTSLSQRLTLLKMAARDAVSSTSNVIKTTSNYASAVQMEFVDKKRSASDGGWVDVRLQRSASLISFIGKSTDVELQPGPIGIVFQKSRLIKQFQAVVDSVVPDTQASATGMITTGDVLVAINDESLERVAFLTVIERIILAPRPVVLRFLTPSKMQRELITSSLCIQPHATSL
ncbi:hypothetical protein CCR75_003246 [Bremia lactucae]|uniref:TBC1 domain family member 23 n=1 Tax=Bremia lactucae TaxID=4779 RepID=A0A976FKR0_BRELC|nr:hypothetical protein CCR75_003246 [Bremia lactucae]